MAIHCLTGGGQSLIISERGKDKRNRRTDELVIGFLTSCQPRRVTEGRTEEEGKEEEERGGKKEEENQEEEEEEEKKRRRRRRRRKRRRKRRRRKA